MMKKLKLILTQVLRNIGVKVWTITTAIVVTTAVAPASAATYQDLWSNPNEPGWGVNIAQQGDILFATWFVYGTDNKPVWYVMSEGRKSVAGEVFTGIIYELRGSYLGAPWQGAQLLSPDTGVATFTFTDKKTLVLRYSANGVTVQKNIFRQTFATVPVTGIYFGGETGVLSSGCNPGGSYSALQRFTITSTFPANTSTGPFVMQSVDAQVQPNGQSVACNYTGTAEQFGSLIEVRNGQFTCTNNSAGQFSATDGVFNEEGFLLKPTFVFSNTCRAVAKIGGARQ